MHVKTASHLTERAAVRVPPLDRLAQSVVARGAAPAVVCSAAYRRGDGWDWAVGCAGTLWPISQTPITPDVVFDLASVTKPFVAVAVATESVSNRMLWEAPLHELLPEVRGTLAGESSLELLISHRAGLVPHLELFRSWRAGRTSSPREMLRLAANAREPQPLAQCGHDRALYSDLGYLLAGAAVERRFRQALDAWLSSSYPHWESELGSARQWLARDPNFLSKCVPTEVVPWRGGLVWGRVHDENAWVCNGLGLAGHAGLFGTVAGVVRFGAAVVDAQQGRSSLIPEEAARLTTMARAGGTLRAGFDGKSGSDSSAGPSASDDCFGHLGYTGTSLWCDPHRNIVTAVLSNRICPSRNNLTLRGLRAELHETLFSWAASAIIGQPAYR